MPASMRYEELQKLINILIGDQLAKVDLLTNSDTKILAELLDFGASSSLQDMKLDILFILLNLEETIRNQLGELYISTVEKVYEKSSFLLNFAQNDPFKNYKYMRLINLCVEYCPLINYPHFNEIQANLVKMLRTLAYEREMYDNVSYLKTVIEMFKFLLHFESANRISIELSSPLEDMLLTIVDKYALNLNFKYTTCSKTSKSSSVSVKYSLLENEISETNACIPNPVHVKNSLDSSLLSLALTLYPSAYHSQSLYTRNNKSLWDNVDFNFFIASLLKSSDITLRCAVLTYLICPYLEQENKWQDKKWLQLYLPYLVDTLNFSNIPWWFDPFENLILLIDLYHKHEPLNNPVITFLTKTNVMYGLLTLFAQCLSLKTQSRSSMNCTTKFIRLCASFAAYDELYRTLLLEQKFLLHHLEFGLESHLKLLKQFLAYRDKIIELEGPGVLNLPPIYDKETVMAWLLLLKSFSRSVSALRTSLKSNKLAELLLELLRVTYDITQDCDFAGNDFLKAEIDIMGVNLGCICNFVVEFSNLQSFMLKNGIVKITGEILNDPLFNSKRRWKTSRYNDSFDRDSIDSVKTNALWVLRHLMYNCQNSEKLELLSEVPMSTILEFINDPSWSVQEQCFQLIRNLTCNSRKVVNILLENFQNIDYKNDRNTGSGSKLVTGSTYLFEYLARKMLLLNPSDSIQKKTLEGVLYIIVNLAAVNENKKELVIEQAEILSIIRDILSESPQNLGHYSNDSKLKLACLWVLNNLLWDSTISRYTHYSLEGYAPSPHEEGPKQGNSTWVYGNSNAPTHSNAEEFEDESEYDSDTKDDDNDSENVEEEFVHGPGVGADSAIHTNRATVERCKKLVDMGIYDLVKQNKDEDSLSVREKAKTLQYHMDLLLKGSI
ncbi:hypothetical protein HG535_0F03140 [Zygotorulaspora mrakii]|uniref:Uncharacterized protein n=1 Tax=Zygotorulaspora mrakii TaxID=42260 RepID=A0A7H9B5Q4_ZYGMR|nr:uncharacterized protein HG535_0F03140 [Zygotorulaspora mrakii]QLG73803.1 hypothetical protein HG535_0F03140 [Zygotorulaspora mrakii]